MSVVQVLCFTVHKEAGYSLEGERVCAAGAHVPVCKVTLDSVKHLHCFTPNAGLCY